MRREPSADERDRLLKVFRRVGRGKCTGHLPPRTARDPPRLRVEDLAVEAASGGLAAPVLEAAERRTESGAPRAFDRQGLARLLAERRAPDRVGRPAEPDGFVRAAVEWLEPGRPALPIVRQASGDHASG